VPDRDRAAEAYAEAFERRAEELHDELLEPWAGRYTAPELSIEDLVEELLEEHLRPEGLRFAELAGCLGRIADELGTPVAVAAALVLGCRLSEELVPRSLARGHAANIASLLVTRGAAQRTALTPAERRHWANRLLATVPVRFSGTVPEVLVAELAEGPRIAGEGETWEDAAFALWGSAVGYLEQLQVCPSGLLGLAELDEEFNRWRAETLKMLAENVKEPR
jgi:hypothetical protein